MTTKADCGSWTRTPKSIATSFRISCARRPARDIGYNRSPDPLADIARTSAGHDRVLSTGTFLDSLRFRVYLGEHFDVDANQVEAQVIGEHGILQVFLWSTARMPAYRLTNSSRSAANRSMMFTGKSKNERSLLCRT